MEKSEIIFFAIIIAAYLLCAFTLNMPTFVHYIFIAMILIVLLITILVRFQDKFKNRQIKKILNILSVVFLALYIICTTYEMAYQKTLVVDSSILLIPFFGSLMLGWFFKNSDKS